MKSFKGTKWKILEIFRSYLDETLKRFSEKVRKHEKLLEALCIT